MFASFTDKADLTPYAAEPARIDLDAVNTAIAYGAERSSRMDFSEYDRIDDFELNEILWRAVKGQDAPLPPAVRRAIAYRPSPGAAEPSGGAFQAADRLKKTGSRAVAADSWRWPIPLPGAHATDKIVRDAMPAPGRRDRFPVSGLSEVAAELLTVAEEAAVRAERIRRPNIPLRIAVAVLLVAAGAFVVGMARSLQVRTDLWDVVNLGAVREAALGLDSSSSASPSCSCSRSRSG